MEDEEKAVKRVCEKFDIYWNESLFAASSKVSTGFSRMKGYVSKANLIQYKGKTFDTYHDELEDEENDVIESSDEIKEKTTKVTKKMFEFWGPGYRPEEYIELQNEYNDWVSRYECQTKAQEEVFQNIVLAKINVRRAYQDGDTKKIKDATSVLQGLMNDASIMPRQKNNNSMVEQNTFGTLIEKYENERPIPEPAPEWKDVDNIRHYINVWFFGHLCSMLGIKSKYADEYDEYIEELDRLSVTPPSYSDDDDYNSEIADIFEQNQNRNN